ncbi:MAG: hypothetical protein CVU23_03615 [Betaproteobacteria bacterium HGW-Betaproteobacteria-17]|nr:MAG: hypothetical protein CVU23_03615 [Betaproteobacteria bacterium HGW-Betaproteobacteria-17]
MAVGIEKDHRPLTERAGLAAPDTTRDRRGPRGPQRRDGRVEIGGLRAANLGTSGLFRLNIPAGRDWMFAGSVWVENLPLDEETGFRMALDANWFVSDNLSIMARVGLAARTIDRIGPNVGLGVAGHF